jgi:hypothetical protein
MGSSTAYGTGAQPEADSSWVRRVNYYYKYQNQVVDTVYNIALGGYDPYHGLPNWYTPAPFYNLPDPQRNITKANSFSPTVIIVSFVSNNFNVPGLPTDSILRVLQLIKDSANKAGRVCFISTTQPRTSFDALSRQRLKVLKDSIINRFGFYAINFYDSLVNPVDNSILPQFASPYDQVHLNNAGHRMIARQVIAKNIFNITTTRSRKSGNWNDPQVWDKGIIPGPNDSISVQAGHTLTLNTSAQVKGLSVEPGATLVVDNNEAEVVVGNLFNRNRTMHVRGALLINEGKLTIYGRLQQEDGSSFVMNGGEISIDGNSGNEENSIEDGKHLFDISSDLDSFSFTGGTLQIVNPPLGSNSEAIRCPYNFGAGSILKLGNGISTVDANQPNGFGGALLPGQIGRLVIDAVSTNNNRIFTNVNALTVKGFELLSGRYVQAGPLNVEKPD